MILAAILVISLFWGYSISSLKFNYDFEKFFPVGDPDLEYYLNYRQQFENDNDYLLIGLRHSTSMFEREFLSRIDSLSNALRALPQVRTVHSITNAQWPLLTPMGWLPVPLIHMDQPDRWSEDSIKIFQRDELVGTLVSSDGRSVNVLVKHRLNIKKLAADSLMTQVNGLVDSLQFEEYHIAGKIRAQPVYLNIISNELMMFMSASLVLIVLFLIWTYRALWAVIIPLMVVALSGLWVLGFMAMVNKPLDVMMVLLPTIVFIVGMSDVVHILTRYIEELRSGKNKIKALKVTIKEVGVATFLTSLTTGVGFLTLMTSAIQPIRDFGLYTALGVLIAYILAFSLLPASLLFIPQPNIVGKVKQRMLWLGALGSVWHWSRQNRWWVLGAWGLILLISLLGSRQLRINTFLIDDLPREHVLRQDFLFFDQQFGGSRPFEMSIEVHNDQFTIWDQAILKQLENMEVYLLNSYGTSHLTSPLEVVRVTNQAINGGGYQHYKIPSDSSELKRIERHLKQTQKLPGFQSMISDDLRTARFSGRMGDIGSYPTLKNNRALLEFIKNETDTTLVDFRLTGTSLLIDKNTEYLVENMILGLSIAFGVVAIIAGLMFRSFRMVLITLVPNIIPLLMVGGLMGLLGITLKLTTSVVFTVAFGIAVDDTIHFISRFKLEIAKGLSKGEALKQTYLSTGKAIVITTAILVSGFLTLLLSSFGGTFYIGLFVGLTLLFALVIDLTLLPVLIWLFYKS